MMRVGGNFSRIASGAKTGDMIGLILGSAFFTKEETQNFKKDCIRMGSSKAMRVDG